MYRTRKFRKNGGTKKEGVKTKSSKLRQRVKLKKSKSKKAQGPGYSSTETDEFGREHREWGNSEASPRQIQQMRGQLDEASDLMDRYGEASPAEIARMRPRRKSRTLNKKATIGVTAGVLVTIAALLANSKNTPTPNVRQQDFNVAQAEVLNSIEKRLKEGDVSQEEKKAMKEASDILGTIPSQGKYNTDPSIKVKRQEALKEQKKQHKADMATLARRRSHPKGPKPIPDRLKKKYQPKPL